MLQQIEEVREESASLLVMCAWCGKVIRDADTSRPRVSHGICATCAAATGVLEVESLLGLSSEAYDRLPMGVVELDSLGIITRYNAAEQKLAGLTPESVLGRNFFRDVAPCTAVRDLEAKYAEVVASGGCEQRVELDFVFRFASGDRLVSVVLGYDPDRARGLVIVRESV